MHANALDESKTPLWTPSDDAVEASHMFAFKTKIEKDTGLSLPDYKSLHQWSIDNVESFWSRFWDDAGVIGEKGQAPYVTNADVFPCQDGRERARFFPEAQLNFAQNLLRKNDDTPAMIFRSEGGFVKSQITWAHLNRAVSQFAQGLKSLGVKKGDRVCALMPNMIETIIAMLGVTSLGAVWASASPDFGTQGVLDRFGQIEPSVMIAVKGYYYNGKIFDCVSKIEEIAAAIPSLQKIIAVDYAPVESAFKESGKIISYAQFMAAHEPNEIDFEAVEFDHPLYIMFSSGTTGIPKCIVHGTGGTLLQHLKEHRLQCNVSEGDRVFYFTTCGWMMWNWLVSALGCGATLVLFDGAPTYPDANVLWDYADDEKITLFGTSAKYIDAIKKMGAKPRETHDLSSVKMITSTGSPLVPESFDYVYQDIKSDVQLASISGGTDIVSCFVIGNPLSPVWRGEIQGAGLAYDMNVLDENGKNLEVGQGEFVCSTPFPSMPIYFWNDKDNARYKSAYFDEYPNIWCHGDWVEKTPHGGFIIHGRSDATLNPGGVRIGTAEIYRQVEQLPDVLESIAVGQDYEGDVRVVLFVRLKEGVTLDENLIKTIKTAIRTGATPRHVPAVVAQVTDIPRTKSGKITELAVKHIIHGKAVKNKEALANPEALEQYKNRSELA